MHNPPLRFYIRLAALSASCFLAVPQVIAQSQDSIAYLGQPALEGRQLPFSEAVRVGNLLFLSGQIGLDPGTGKLVAGGIQPETRPNPGKHKGYSGKVRFFDVTSDQVYGVPCGHF
jgi:hypothetical protein